MAQRTPPRRGCLAARRTIAPDPVVFRTAAMLLAGEIRRAMTDCAPQTPAPRSGRRPSLHSIYLRALADLLSPVIMISPAFRSLLPLGSLAHGLRVAATEE